MRHNTRSLGLVLFALGTSCVINTRPHLPFEDDGGRAAMTSNDASASFDSGAFTGVVGDAAADSAPPTASPDAGVADDVDTATENSDCLPADADRGDGGVRYDGGDAARVDGGDSGFTDSKGRACDPTAHRRDGGVHDAHDVPRSR